MKIKDLLEIGDDDEFDDENIQRQLTSLFGPSGEPMVGNYYNKKKRIKPEKLPKVLSPEELEEIEFIKQYLHKLWEIHFADFQLGIPNKITSPILTSIQRIKHYAEENRLSAAQAGMKKLKNDLTPYRKIVKDARLAQQKEWDAIRAKRKEEKRK